MPIIQPQFANEYYYHIYNRGVAKQDIFHEDSDYNRLLDTLAFYIDRTQDKKFSMVGWNYLKTVRSMMCEKPLVEIIAFCLMPNHFHILVKQVVEQGVSMFLRRVLNSYTHYYNTKRKRVGTIFQGTFRAITIGNNEQLLHVSRYIHLNPFAARLVDKPDEYQWSSYRLMTHGITNRLCNPTILFGLSGSSQNYQKFIEDYADYARSISDLKHLLIDLTL